MTLSTPLKALPSRTLWQRFLRFALITGLLLLLGGGALSLWMLHLHTLTAKHARVLEVEAQTAQTILHTYRLSDALEKAYPAQDATYLKRQLSPWLQALREDAQHLNELRRDFPPDSPVALALLHAQPYLQREFTLAQGLIDAAKVNNWPSAKIRRETLKINHRLLLLSMQQTIQKSEAYRQNQFRNIQTTLRHGRLAAPLPIILGLLLLLILAFETHRLLIQPLHALTERMQQFTEGDFSVRLPVQRNDEIGQLAHTFNLMADRIQKSQATLSQRVAERTEALQRRTIQLQAATEIGRAVTTQRDLPALLNMAARLLSQRFNFYHVGIFLADKGSGQARLEAAYAQRGDTAQRLLAQGYTVSFVGEGPVSRALSTGRPQTAQYAEEAAPLPECKDTRGEIAIPLRVGEDILGVIDIHSDTQDTFPPEDVAALQAVADILSVAIVNARLFQQTAEALEASRRAYAALSQQGWQRLLRRRQKRGFRLTADGRVLPLALEEQSTPPPDDHEPEKTKHALRLPVKIRGRTIAIAHLRKSTPWQPQERRLLEQVGERLGVILESARLYAEAQRRAGQLQIAAEIARDTSATLDLEELLRKAINLVRDRFGFYHASVFLLDESGHYAVVKESTGEAGRQMKARGHRLAVGSKSIVGQTLARRAPVVVNDVSKSDIHHFNPLLPETRAEAAIPLMAGQQLIGAIDIQSTQIGAFAEEDIRVLHILADQLAVAIINANLFAETQAHLERHRELHQIIAAAVASDTLETAYRNAVESIHAMRPGEDVLLLTPEPEQPDTLRITAWAGSSYAAEKMAERHFSRHEGLIGQAIQQHAPQILNTPEQRPLLSNAQAELVVPLEYRDELLGALVFSSPQPNAFDPLALEMSRTLAQSLSAIFANIRLLEQVRRHAQELTMLYEITAAAASHVELEPLLQDLAHRLREGFNALHCGVVLFEKDADMGTLVASDSAPNAPGAGMLGTKLPLRTPFVQQVIENRKPFVCRDVEHGQEKLGAAQPLLSKRGAKQVILLPLLARDQVIGTLGLDIGDATRQITAEELRLLEQIAHQIATSIEVARLFQQAVRTAERERLVTEITTKMRATNDPQAIIQTALEELRRALHAQQAQVLFVTNGQNPTSEPDQQPQG